MRLESDAGANAWAVAAEKGYGCCAEGSGEGRDLFETTRGGVNNMLDFQGWCRARFFLG